VGPVPPPIKRQRLLSETSLQADKNGACCLKKCIQHLAEEDYREARQSYAFGNEHERSQQLLNFMFTSRNPDQFRWAYVFRGQVSDYVILEMLLTL